jgi:hypothetical protein
MDLVAALLAALVLWVGYCWGAWFRARRVSVVSLTIVPRWIMNYNAKQGQLAVAVGVAANWKVGPPTNIEDPSLYTVSASGPATQVNANTFTLDAPGEVELKATLLANPDIVGFATIIVEDYMVGLTLTVEIQNPDVA